MGLQEFFNSIIGIFIRKKSSQDIYNEAMQERSELKDDIRQSLMQLNFTNIEIREVLLIIDDAEKKINALKAKLTGSNIGGDSPRKMEQYIHSQIQAATNKMSIDLKAKVEEIQARKIKK